MYGSFASWMALRTAAFGSKNDGQASTPAAQHTQRQTDNLNTCKVLCCVSLAWSNHNLSLHTPIRDMGAAALLRTSTDAKIIVLQCTTTKSQALQETTARAAPTAPKMPNSEGKNCFTVPAVAAA